MSDRDAFRAEQQERRLHGLKARHETREARAVRKAVAEEIALAIEARSLPGPERDMDARIAREIGSRDPA